MPPIKKLRPKPGLSIVRRQSSNLRLQEWQSSPELVAKGQELLQNPIMQIVLDVMANESPVHLEFAESVTIEHRAMQQAKVEGYHLCLTNIKSIGFLNV